MSTLEERISALENQMPQLATKEDLAETEKRMESRLYTALTEMEGRMNARLYTALTEMEGRMNARFDSVKIQFNETNALFNNVIKTMQELVAALKEHNHRP